MFRRRFSWEVAIVPAAHPAQSFNHNKKRGLNKIGIQSSTAVIPSMIY